ncbi:hypothetical protein B0J14DRAFT_467622 [Halenospora varia]|nr:hypothetical protein B0J14DRAFT_467622 [Halenospora varia]
MEPGTVEKPHQLVTVVNTKWAKPHFTLPVRSLQFLFHLKCEIESFRHIGGGGHGDRSTIIFKGGRFEGPKLRGEILPGGGDWETIQDHDGDQQTAHLDTRYNLLTEDGVCIFLTTTGTQTRKKATLEELGDEDKHTPYEYRMRLYLTLESGDKRYPWLNNIVAIASSARNGSRVIYAAYQVL